MAGLNTRVVRRSNALQGWAYGRRFRYREVALGAALKALAAGLAFRLTTADHPRDHERHPRARNPDHPLALA
jgi:short subunit dehydrogenase-like uncharacterized protein